MAATITEAAEDAAAVTHAARIEHVSKSFHAPGTPGGQQLVLDDITLDVAPGEFVTLLGASGCGKSTLLNLVAGLDRPSTGSIDTDGRPALMFQEHALFPWLTAGKNIELALKLRGVAGPERRQEAERLLELVRLQGAYGKRVHELSGGMRQRVALARALAQDSRLLLMDEPFAALDAITRDVLHDELTRIWTETGLSVLVAGRPGHGKWAGRSRRLGWCGVGEVTASMPYEGLPGASTQPSAGMRRSCRSPAPTSRRWVGRAVRPRRGRRSARGRWRTGRKRR
ncbi:ABC transporter ATP-binding protein [Streptomyces sp. NPDC001816]|uniref:ABC transporter ATP-binding protein n=1 Tax=Streptomyces sp. NPDC001816 TaxID=3364612 RepID=UPI00368F5D5B